MIDIVKKDIKLFLKDKRNVLLTFLLPIILISLFAFAFGGIGSKNDRPPIDLLITDLDSSAFTAKIISTLDSLQTLTLEKSDLDDAKVAVGKGNYAGVLMFYKGFGDSALAGNSLLMELLYDKIRETEIGMLQTILIT